MIDLKLFVNFSSCLYLLRWVGLFFEALEVD